MTMVAGLRAVRTKELGELACVLLLSVAALGAPIALGATAAWPRFMLEATMAAVAVIWAISACRPASAMLLIIGISALACVQLLPLPDRVLMSLAPISGAAWKVALAESGAGWGTIAIHPAATAAGIRRLLLGLALVAAVADLTRFAQWRRWIILSIAASGVIIWALGLIFPVNAKDRVILGSIDLKGPIDYWLTPVEPPLRTCGVGERVTVTTRGFRYETLDSRAGDGFGPYIYSNHFAGALCLCVPALCAAVLTIGSRLNAWPFAVSLAAAIAAGAAIYTSAEIVHSRAGAAALLCGVLGFFALTSPSRLMRRILAAVLAIYVAVLLCFVLVFFGQFRIASLLPAAWQPAAGSLLTDPRVQETAVAMKMFRASPLLGTGLTSYGELNRKLNPGRFVSYYAHNDYAQLLAETGLLGGVVALALGVIMLRLLFHFLRQGDGQDRALSAAAWGGVAALAVHSFFDWNLHCPANAFLASLIVGVAAGTGLPPQRMPARQPSMGYRAAQALFVVVAVLTAAALSLDARSDRALHDLRHAIAADRARAGTPPRDVVALPLPAAINAAEGCAGQRACDAQLSMALAQAYSHLATEPPSLPNAARSDAVTVWYRRALRASAAVAPPPEPREPSAPARPR